MTRTGGVCASARNAPGRTAIFGMPLARLFAGTEAPAFPLPEIDMYSTLKHLVCRFLAVAMMMLPFQHGQAGMIGTEQAGNAATVQLDRNTVSNYLARTQTVNELQTLGLDAQNARDRVAAMTDDEVGTLAGKINAAPAGGDGLVLLILVVFFIWYFAFRR